MVDVKVVLWGEKEGGLLLRIKDEDGVLKGEGSGGYLVVSSMCTGASRKSRGIRKGGLQ
jgi:hypothetical protein